MTKSELKPGYVVRSRNGQLRMVMPLHNSGEYVLVEMETNNPHHGDLKDFDEDLMNRCGLRNTDIVEVYGFSKNKRSVWSFDGRDRNLLWKRPEKKKYTYAQLREILGEEFEVVG